MIYFRPPQFYHHFTISALVGALRRAAQKRKLIREDKTSDRLDKKEDASRSNSQASEATTSRPAGLTGMSGHVTRLFTGQVWHLVQFVDVFRSCTLTEVFPLFNTFRCITQFGLGGELKE